jgi:hypothetical protein
MNPLSNHQIRTRDMLYILLLCLSHFFSLLKIIIKCIYVAHIRDLHEPHISNDDFKELGGWKKNGKSVASHIA